jgi:hypothetical protein
MAITLRQVLHRQGFSMGLVKKLALYGVIIAAITLVYVLQDWYRFAKHSEIDPQRGIFGNSHLEVWIDINARMPSPMRQWACKTLLDRQEAAMGRPGAEPYGCTANFDEMSAMTVSDGLMQSFLAAAEYDAQQRGGTPAQVEAVKTCMQTDFIAKVTPEQIAGMNADEMDNALMTEVSAAAGAAMQACLAQQGL